MKNKIIISSLFIVAIILLFNTCKKEEPQPDSKLPIVTIDSITNISLTTATVNADISFNGGYPVTERGICWSTSQNPTTTNSKTKAGPGEGLFSGKVTGLVKGTVYYVRAYATNSEGTGYSGQQSVKPGSVTDIDGNVYDLVTIGGRIWIASNLRVTKYSNGDPIPLVTTNGDWKSQTLGAYCYVNNSAGNTKDYGLLYNWFAAADSRGICPKGFRTLVDNAYWGLSGGGSGGSGASLKDTGTKYWKAPNTGATNSSGFSARGTGFRDADGVYTKFNEINYFWDTAWPMDDKAYVAWMDYNDADFTANFWTLDKNHGLCIRCLLQ